MENPIWGVAVGNPLEWCGQLPEARSVDGGSVRVNDIRWALWLLLAKVAEHCTPGFQQVFHHLTEP